MSVNHLFGNEMESSVSGSVELLHKISKTTIKASGTWILGTFKSPQPIYKNSDVRFLRLCIWVENDTGRLLNTTIFEDRIDLMVLDQTMRLIINSGHKPKKIVVHSDAMHDVMHPVLRKLNIACEKEEPSRFFRIIMERIISSINS